MNLVWNRRADAPVEPRTLGRPLRDVRDVRSSNSRSRPATPDPRRSRARHDTPSTPPRAGLEKTRDVR